MCDDEWETVPMKTSNQKSKTLKSSKNKQNKQNKQYKKSKTFYPSIKEYISTLEWEITDVLCLMEEYCESEYITMMDNCNYDDLLEFVTFFSNP